MREPQWERSNWGPVRGWLSLAEMCRVRAELREQGRKLVFTNGCFDLLHAGHLTYLEQARQMGDALVVGVNGDASVKRLKGEDRPILPEHERAEALASLEAVDYVVIFHEDTPLEIITALLPDALVKGGDWAVNQIVGREVVEANGGRVLNLPVVEGRSTTRVILKIQEG